MNVTLGTYDCCDGRDAAHAIDVEAGPVVKANPYQHLALPFVRRNISLPLKVPAPDDPSTFVANADHFRCAALRGNGQCKNHFDYPCEMCGFHFCPYHRQNHYPCTKTLPVRSGRLDSENLDDDAFESILRRNVCLSVSHLASVQVGEAALQGHDTSAGWVVNWTQEMVSVKESILNFT